MHACKMSTNDFPEGTPPRETFHLQLFLVRAFYGKRVADHQMGSRMEVGLTTVCVCVC
jgi:hypothetical protein